MPRIARTVTRYRMEPGNADAYGSTPPGAPAPREFVLSRTDQDQEGVVAGGGKIRWRHNGAARVTTVARLSRRELARLVTESVEALAYAPEEDDDAAPADHGGSTHY